MASIIRLQCLDGSYKIVRGKFYHSFDVKVDMIRPVELWGDTVGIGEDKKYWVHVKIQNSMDPTGKHDITDTVACYFDLEMAVEVATQMSLLWNRYTQKKVIDMGELIKEAESIYQRDKEVEMWKVSQEARETAEKMSKECKTNWEKVKNNDY